MFQAARIKAQAAAKASSGNIQARGSRSLSAVRSAGGGASAPDTASELRSDSVISVMAAQFSTKLGRHSVSASHDPKLGVAAPASDANPSTALGHSAGGAVRRVRPRSRGGHAKGPPLSNIRLSGGIG